MDDEKSDLYQTFDSYIEDFGKEPPLPEFYIDDNIDPISEVLYPSEVKSGLSVYGVVFYIGSERTPVYGNVVSMISRSEYFTALHNSKTTWTVPLHLFPEVKNLNPVPSSFKIIWNYLNGIYPGITNGPNLWFYPDMTLNDKYMVLYYAGYFNIKDKRIVDHYTTGYIADIRKFASNTKLDVDAKSALVQQMIDLRPWVIASTLQPKTALNNMALIADSFRMGSRNGEIIYGPKPRLLPPDFIEHEVFVHHDIDEKAKEGEVYLQIFAVQKNGINRSLGLYPMISAGTIPIKTFNALSTDYERYNNYFNGDDEDDITFTRIIQTLKGNITFYHIGETLWISPDFDPAYPKRPYVMREFVSPSYVARK